METHNSAWQTTDFTGLSGLLHGTLWQSNLHAELPCAGTYMIKASKYAARVHLSPSNALLMKASSFWFLKSTRTRSLHQLLIC